MLIYKIFRPAEWDALQATGTTTGAPIDIADGYIHLSSAAQVRETAARHFADAGELVLAALEADTLDALKWEPSRGGALFPHLYRDMTTADIVWSAPLPFAHGAHVFPEDVA